MNERNLAKEFYNNKDFENALIIYDKLWNSSRKDDHNLFAEYGNALRKCNKSLNFISEFSKIPNDSYIRKNRYVISVLCWCVYDVYIKDYIDNEKSNFEEFIKMSELITNHSVQREAANEILTPYVLTIKKVVNVYNSRPSTRTSRSNQEKIVQWLEKLNPAILSEECFKTKIGEDEFEQASSKEFYYQNMVKSYEKIGQYEKCILIGKEALEIIKKFHYKNKIWITGRILYSECMISNNREIDFQNYKTFAEKENYWFLWHKLANICYSFGKFKESLLYNCKAIHNEIIDETKVTLLYNLGLCWESQGRNDNASVYYHACAYFRCLMGWNLSEELQYYISEYKLDVTKRPNMYQLKSIARDYIEKNDNEYLFGRIDNILKNGHSGFIKQDNNENNIYFNMRNVIGNKHLLHKGKRVKYKVVINDNEKTEAICVEGVK